MKTPVFSLRLEPETLRALEYFAHEQGCSVSALIRQLVNEFIDRQNKK